MKRLVVACALVAVAVVGPAYAAPLPPPDCCACVLGDDGPPAVFFCVSPASEEEKIAADDRCDGIPFAQLRCLFSVTSTDTAAVTDACVEQLRDLGVICPVRPGAPALGRTALFVLAGVLGILGASTLRRRAARPG